MSGGEPVSEINSPIDQLAEVVLGDELNVVVDVSNFQQILQEVLLPKNVLILEKVVCDGFLAEKF